MARKFLTSLDLSQNELQNARVQQLASAPSSPVEGQIYYNTTDHSFYVYSGDPLAWTAVDSTTLSFGTTGDMASSAVGDTAAAGSSGKVADAGHRHARESFGSATAQTSFGASSGNGSASTVARSDHTHGTPAHDASAHSSIKISDLAAPTGSVAFNSQRITGLADPSSNQDAATKAYVDGAIEGLSWKDSVRASTTTAGTLASDFEDGDVIDGVTLATGDRILIKNQSTGSENGIYTVNASGAPTRAVDANTAAELRGAAVFVEEGTANAGAQYILTTDNITLGTTALVWTQFGGGSTYSAGAGLTLNGSTFNVGAGTGITVNADDVAIDTSVVARKYSTVLSTSATTYTVTHNLNTTDTIVQVYQVSDGAQVECDALRPSGAPNTVTVTFATAPSANAYRVVVTG